MMRRVSSGSPFHHAIELGDYCAALGVSREAKKLDIDVAAARLARQFPSEARKISAVAGVLNHARSRAVYLSACALRDFVLQNLTSQYSANVPKVVPDLQQRVWRSCCRLLHLNLNSSGPYLGPRGTMSLLEEGAAWVTEEVLDAALVPIHPTTGERRAGDAIREFWYVDCPACGHSRRVSCRRLKEGADERSESDAKPTRRSRIIACDAFHEPDFQYNASYCRNCGTTGGRPAEYEGTYSFAISSSRRPIALAEGRRRDRAGISLALIEAITLSRPSALLQQFYQLQQEDDDVTLEEARRRLVAASPATSNTQPSMVLNLLGSMAFSMLIGFVVMGVSGVLGGSRSRPVSRPSHVEGSAAATSEDASRDVSPQQRRPATVRSSGQAISPIAAEAMVGIAEVMASRQPQDPRSHVGLAMAYVTLGRSLAAEDRTDAAMEWYQKSIDVVEQLLMNHPDCVDCFLQLGRAHRGMAALYRKLQQPVGEAQHLQKAVEAFEELRRRSELPAKFDVEYSAIQVHLAFIKGYLQQRAEAIELLESARPRLEAVLLEEVSEQTPSAEGARRVLRYLERVEARVRSADESDAASNP